MMAISRAMRLILGTVLLGALLGSTSADPARREANARPGRPGQQLRAGVFLVATHRVVDPRFSRSVVLLTQYDPERVMGVIINRPTEHQLADLLPHVEALRERSDRLFFGGPVSVDAIVALILCAEEVELPQTTRVFGDVYLSGNPAAFAYIIGREREDEAFRGYAGHAGWAAGQLEGEIARGDWSVVDADAFTVFRREPSAVWRDLSPGPEPGRELRAAR
jgi:putative transcriptional regulator